MTSRRAPLANVPNAVNSPFRNLVANSSKRTRAQTGDPREVVHGQPPTKKQVIELLDDDVENVDPRRRSGVPVTATRENADALFSRRTTTDKQPTAFEQRLASVREKRPAPPQQQQQQRADQAQKANGDNLESVRQWKRHYKRQFPQFVFYFESVPEDIRVKTARQFLSLGASEAKFFSKAVTHVVTTRSIPPELTATSPNEDPKEGSTQPKTVQPSALTQDQRRTTDLLDANLQRRIQSQTAQTSHDVDTRKTQAQAADILIRARQLGIKIWALEKLQRVLKTMLETDSCDPTPGQDARAHAAVGKPTTRVGKDADLEQLLRNEKINGPADRDMTVAAQDTVSFTGCYLYVHDMDEKTKPTMIRDYAKPASKEQGKWPQFRLTPIGRCPFIEDPAHTKKLQQQEREAAKAEQELAMQRKTRGGSAAAPPQPLAEREANLRRSPRKTAQQAQQQQPELSKPLAPPKSIPAKRHSSAEGMPVFNATTATNSSMQQNLRGLPRMIGGEPVASGLQPSNVTSAIRSQAISSAAISSTAPGGVPKRVSDSKEVSALKRKVLERGGGGAASAVTSNHSALPSSYMNDVRAAINNEENVQNAPHPPVRAAKRRAQETLLGVLHEDEDEGGDRGAPRKAAPALRGRKRTAVKEKEAKPGYCENCRDKFEDFDDHILSRKHRKFALTQENWKELDELLGRLRRPHKGSSLLQQPHHQH